MTEIVPRFYKMNVYSSFTRQCNAHGFNVNNNSFFTNEFFRRGDPSSCAKISSTKRNSKRRPPAQEVLGMRAPQNGVNGPQNRDAFNGNGIVIKKQRMEEQPQMTTSFMQGTTARQAQINTTYPSAMGRSPHPSTIVNSEPRAPAPNTMYGAPSAHPKPYYTRAYAHTIAPAQAAVQMHQQQQQRAAMAAAMSASASTVPRKVPFYSAREPKGWKERQVIEWLKCAFPFAENYAPAFIENAVDGRMLFDLTSDLLENELGVTKRLHRIRILRHIRDLRMAFNYSEPPSAYEPVSPVDPTKRQDHREISSARSAYFRDQQSALSRLNDQQNTLSRLNEKQSALSRLNEQQSAFSRLNDQNGALSASNEQVSRQNNQNSAFSRLNEQQRAHLGVRVRDTACLSMLRDVRSLSVMPPPPRVTPPRTPINLCHSPGIPGRGTGNSPCIPGRVFGVGFQDHLRSIGTNVSSSPEIQGHTHSLNSQPPPPLMPGLESSNGVSHMPVDSVSPEPAHSVSPVQLPVHNVSPVPVHSVSRSPSPSGISENEAAEGGGAVRSDLFRIVAPPAELSAQNKENVSLSNSPEKVGTNDSDEGTNSETNERTEDIVEGTNGAEIDQMEVTEEVKKKYSNSVFTDRERDYLESIYEDEAYPGRKMCEEMEKLFSKESICPDSSPSLKQIQGWFKHRRYKSKQHESR
eukprot:238254_1